MRLYVFKQLGASAGEGAPPRRYTFFDELTTLENVIDVVRSEDKLHEADALM